MCGCFERACLLWHTWHLRVLHGLARGLPAGYAPHVSCRQTHMWKLALQRSEAQFRDSCGLSDTYATRPLHAHVRLLRCRAMRADSERLNDSQRRLSIIRETPDKATLEASSPAEGRVKGAGAALSSLGQKESSSENSSLRQKIQNGILKGA